MKVNNKKPQDLLKSIAQSLPVILELKRRMSKKDSEVDNILFEEYKKKEPNSYINSILNIISAQSYGPRFEKYFIKNADFTKISSKKDRGDFRDNNEEYWEYKFTSCLNNNRYNFVQIRPWQDISGYIFEIYSSEDGIKTLEIPKKDMNNLLLKFGGLAHGTKKTNNNEKKEYALRGELGDNLWNKLKKFQTRKFL